MGYHGAWSLLRCLRGARPCDTLRVRFARLDVLARARNCARGPWCFDIAPRMRPSGATCVENLRDQHQCRRLPGLLSRPPGEIIVGPAAPGLFVDPSDRHQPRPGDGRLTQDGPVPPSIVHHNRAPTAGCRPRNPASFACSHRGMRGQGATSGNIYGCLHAGPPRRPTA